MVKTPPAMTGRCQTLPGTEGANPARRVVNPLAAPSQKIHSGNAQKMRKENKNLMPAFIPTL